MDDELRMLNFISSPKGPSKWSCSELFLFSRQTKSGCFQMAKGERSPWEDIHSATHSRKPLLLRSTGNQHSVFAPGTSHQQPVLLLSSHPAPQSFNQQVCINVWVLLDHVLLLQQALGVGEFSAPCTQPPLRLWLYSFCSKILGPILSLLIPWTSNSWPKQDWEKN